MLLPVSTRVPLMAQSTAKAYSDNNLRLRQLKWGSCQLAGSSNTSNRTLQLES